MGQIVEERDISSLEISPDIIKDGAKILEALSNEDAIILFLYAENGIQNSTEAIKNLGMTQKRYYSRLKQYLDAGPIARGRLSIDMISGENRLYYFFAGTWELTMFFCSTIQQIIWISIIFNKDKLKGFISFLYTIRAFSRKGLIDGKNN